MAVAAPTTVSYVYNALGQRVSKAGPGSPTYFMYDEAGHLLGEVRTRWRVDPGDGVAGRRCPSFTLRPKSGGGVEVLYVHTDHLGTPRLISRPSDNALMWRWDSDAFGTGLPKRESARSRGVQLQPQRFAGQCFDAESWDLIVTTGETDTTRRLAATLRVIPSGCGAV